MYRLNHERQKIQEFRKTIVLQLRDLEPAERSRLIDELTERTFNIPFSKKRTLSRAVIYQWLKEFNESLDQGKALLPKRRADRETFRSLSDEQKAALIKWRQENAYRSATQLREELMAHPETNTVPIPSESTIVRYLRSLNLEVLKDPPLTLAEANEYLAALISQDYHRRIHSETNQTPEEKFFQFPVQYRRFVSQETLAMIYLPCTRSRVSKTGLIHLKKKQYLVPDISLYKQWVEVRFDPLDQAKVYVWCRDRYYGEAWIYVTDNDYVKRQEYLARLQQLAQARKPQVQLGQIYVPPYSRLERQLAEYRQQLAERDLNDAITQTLLRKEQIKAELAPLVNHPLAGTPPAGTLSASQSRAKDEMAEFGLDRCTHLLNVLLRRPLDARERLSLATVWRHYGPFTEELVRQTVGRLLGEGHPVSDLMGYLDALRLAAGKTNADA
ncbi:MAG: Mu transposase C-terminal domain-containing protein [Bacillota bacterium]